jgi:hypothetical protein
LGLVFVEMSFTTKVKITLKTVASKTLTTNGSLSTPVDCILYPTKDTVRSVKERFALAQAVPFPEQDLVLEGRVLDDDMRIVDCGVKNNASLDFVVRATQGTLAQQLAELLDTKPVASAELGFLYSLKFGVSFDEALDVLGIAGQGMEDFALEQKLLRVVDGCIGLACKDDTPKVKIDTKMAETPEKATVDDEIVVEEIADVVKDVDSDVLGAWQRVGASIKDSMANFEEDDIETLHPFSRSLRIRKSVQCENKEAPVDVCQELPGSETTCTVAGIDAMLGEKVDVAAWEGVSKNINKAFSRIIDEDDSDSEESLPQVDSVKTCTVSKTDSMLGDKVDVVAWKGVSMNINKAFSRIIDEDVSDLEEFLPQPQKVTLNRDSTKLFSHTCHDVDDEEIRVEHWQFLGARIHQTLAMCGTEESDCEM